MGVTNIPITATTTDFVGAINAARTAISGFDRDLNTKLVNSFRVLDRTQRDYDKGIGRIQKQLQEQARLAKAAADAGKGGSFVNQFSGLPGITSGLLSAGAALTVLKQGLQLTSDFQRIDASLRAVSTSSADYARTQIFLQSTSDQLGLSYEDLATAYKGLKAASNGTVLEGEQTERIFSAVARAGAALKLSGDEVKGSLLAIQQMMSKGTIQAEELRGQLGERLPGAFKLMAQGLGVTEAKLNKMLEQGEVLATDALPKLAVQLEKTYGKQSQDNVDSMGVAFTRASNQAKRFIVEFSQTSGIDAFFAKIGNGLATTIQGMRELNRLGQGSIFSAIGGLGNFQKNVLAERAGQQRAEFGTLPRPQQLARLELLADQIKNASLLEQTIFVPLLKDLKQQYQGNRRNDRRATENEAPVDNRLKLDTLRKRQSALAEEIANGKLNGENVTKLQAEYDRLTRQIDNATGSTKRHHAAVDNQSVGLTTNERILKSLTFRLKQYGDTADGSRSKQRALFEQLVAQDKERANAKPVDLGNNANPLKTSISFADAISGLSGGSRVPELPGLKEYQESITKGATATKAITDAASASLRVGAASMIEGIATGLASGGNPLQNALKVVLDVLSTYLIQIGSALLTAATFSEAAALFPNPLSPWLAANGINQYLAGGVLLAGGAAIKGLKGFANGGVFDRPSVGLFGEYAGATFNREIATPENLMRDVFKGSLNNFARENGASPFNQLRANSSNRNATFNHTIKVEGVVKGSDIHIALRRHEVTLEAFGS